MCSFYYSRQAAAIESETQFYEADRQLIWEEDRS